MPNLRGSEWLIIILLVALLFGAKRMPEAARSLGRSLRIFKAETKGLTQDPVAPAAQAAPASPAAQAAPVPRHAAPPVAGTAPAPTPATPAQADPIPPALYSQPPTQA